MVRFLMKQTLGSAGWLAGGQQLMKLASMPNSLPYLPTARGPSFILDPRILLATLGAAD